MITSLAAMAATGVKERLTPNFSVLPLTTLVVFRTNGAELPVNAELEKVTVESVAVPEKLALVPSGKVTVASAVGALPVLMRSVLAPVPVAEKTKVPFAADKDPVV